VLLPHSYLALAAPDLFCGCRGKCFSLILAPGSTVQISVHRLPHPSSEGFLSPQEVGVTEPFLSPLFPRRSYLTSAPDDPLPLFEAPPSSNPEIEYLSTPRVRHPRKRFPAPPLPPFAPNACDPCQSHSLVFVSLPFSSPALLIRGRPFLPPPPSGPSFRDGSLGRRDKLTPQSPTACLASVRRFRPCSSMIVSPVHVFTNTGDRPNPNLFFCCLAIFLPPEKRLLKPFSPKSANVPPSLCLLSSAKA